MVIFCEIVEKFAKLGVEWAICTVPKLVLFFPQKAETKDKPATKISAKSEDY